ncbi:MAG: chemotaxis response regulator protein-glutamate methylesterase [Terriglobales bacterium]
MSHSSSHAPVKVLIADDSAFMRASLSRMVESDKSLCVVGTAQTGLETLAQIGALHPDVVTLDIDMPGLNGLETLKRVMSEALHPAVIIVSALARKGAEATLEALELGAFDCIAKQLSYASADVLRVQNELVGKIKAAAGPRPLAPRASYRLDRTQLHAVATHRARAATVTVPSLAVPSIIAIGTSTGGPKALQDVLRALPADLPAGILIVQHMPIGFIGPLAKRLNDLCPLEVREAEEGDLITAGRVYLAPSGKHLTVRRRSSSEVALHLSLLPSNSLHIPSTDVMMSSVAECFGASAMGIILTGMGADGALGMRAIFRGGGLTLGQDQATCVVYGMPRSCAEMGVLSQTVPLPDIPLHILAALRYRKPH